MTLAAALLTFTCSLIFVTVDYIADRRLNRLDSRLGPRARTGPHR